MAFTGNYVTNTFLVGLLNGVFNFTSGNYYIALYTNSATLNASTQSYTNAGEVSAPGYTAGGQLLVSNQVTWLSTDAAGNPIAIPVNLDDTSYTEKKTRDGKLYNVTFKVRYANNYWS